MADRIGYTSLDKAAPRPAEGEVLSHAWTPQLAANLDNINYALIPYLRPNTNNGHNYEEPSWAGLTESTASPDINSSGFMQHGQLVTWAAHTYFDDTSDDLAVALPSAVPAMLLGAMPVCVGSVVIERGSIYHGTAIYDGESVTFWGDGERLNQTSIGAGTGYISVNGFYRCAPPLDPRQLTNLEE